MSSYFVVSLFLYVRGASGFKCSALFDTVCPEALALFFLVVLQDLGNQLFEMQSFPHRLSLQFAMQRHTHTGTNFRHTNTSLECKDVAYERITFPPHPALPWVTWVVARCTQAYCVMVIFSILFVKGVSRVVSKKNPFTTGRVVRTRNPCKHGRVVLRYNYY